MKQLVELLCDCYAGERYAIVDMLLRAAKFVHAEAVSRVVAMNITGKDNEGQQEKTFCANRAIRKL